MIDVDVVLVDLDARTAFCSDGVTRAVLEWYGRDGKPTDDTYEAFVAVVQIEKGEYVVLNLDEGLQQFHG